MFVAPFGIHPVAARRQSERIERVAVPPNRATSRAKFNWPLLLPTHLLLHSVASALSGGARLATCACRFGFLHLVLQPCLSLRLASPAGISVALWSPCQNWCCSAWRMILTSGSTHRYLPVRACWSASPSASPSAGPAWLVLVQLSRFPPHESMCCQLQPAPGECIQSKAKPALAAPPIERSEPEAPPGRSQAQAASESRIEHREKHQMQAWNHPNQAT